MPEDTPSTLLRRFLGGHRVSVHAYRSPHVDRPTSIEALSSSLHFLRRLFLCQPATNPVQTPRSHPPPLRCIPGPVEFDYSQTSILGGYNEVFRGHHVDHGAVALRRPKQMCSQTFELAAEFWSSLQHPNTLPLLGSYVANGRTYTVSPWAENGTLRRYVQENPDACRRLLLLQAAEGLLYLHERGLIHGDVKPVNMLVTADGQVQLCDFDTCHPASDFEHPLAKAMNTLQYRSPEIMRDQNAPKTFKSDVYAFGMTIHEVLSGKGPFEITTGAIYCAVLISKERPQQEPAGSPSGEPYEALWDLATDCWHEDPEQRPTMEDVVRRLKEPLCNTA